MIRYCDECFDELEKHNKKKCDECLSAKVIEKVETQIKRKNKNVKDEEWISVPSPYKKYKEGV